MGIGVIPIPIYVRFNSFPFHSHSQIGVLFPFPLNSNAIPIPTGIPINAVSSLAWWVHSRQWWLRRCSSLTGSSNWKSTRRMLLPTHNRETWKTDSMSNSRAWSPWWRYRTHLQNKTSSAIVQTDRATRYGPNSVTSICCGFDVQNHNNQQRIHNRSTANRTPTANRQHLKLHSTSRTSCKLVAHPSCQLVGKLHRESKKTRHHTLGHNFSNYYPIFKIFSLAVSAVSLQQTHV